MKKFLFLAAGVLSLTLGSQAQTVAPIGPEPQPITITGTGVNTATAPTNTDWTLTKFLSGGWGQAGKDVVRFVEGTTNNGVVQVEAGALIGLNSKDVGGFVDVMLPIAGTNSVFGAGIGLAYLNGNFYDATLNARLGDTFKLPLIKIPVYAYIESGGGYNISKMEVIAQAFTGVTLPIPITDTQTLTLGAAIGTISDVSENVLAVGGSYTWTF